LSFASNYAVNGQALLNRMQGRFHCFCGSIDAVSGKFNLVLANLQAPVHAQMFDHYRRLLPQQDNLPVVSGFDDIHGAYMKKELVQRGFSVTEKVTVQAPAAALAAECSDIWAGYGLKRVRDFWRVNPQNTQCLQGRNSSYRREPTST
jgi:hypothetical protein